MASENHENQIPEEEVLEREEKNSELPEEEVLKQEEERSELPEEEQKPATEEVSSTAQALETGRKRKPHDMDQFAKDYEEKNRIDTKASRRKWWIKTGLMLALIAVSIVLMFTITKYVGGGTQGFGKTFSNANWSWFAVVLAVLLLMMLAEILKYSYLLRISTGKWRLKNSAKVMFLGKYYDGITPLGTGGQPFQIYYLHKRNVPAGAATAVPLIRYFISTFVFCLMAVVLFIAAGFVVDLNSTVGTTAMVIAWISMIFNFAMPLVILFASLFPRAGKKFILRIINLLAKMHIVKRKYAVSRKYVYEMDEYRHALQTLFKEFWKLIPIVLLSFVEVICYVALPFTVVVFVANIAPTWKILLEIACLTMISFYSSSLVPTPGNSGASEAMTTLVFVTIISVSGVEPVIGWIVLLWRFLTYYVYILSGIGISIFEIIRSAVRVRRAKKQQQA